VLLFLKNDNTKNGRKNRKMGEILVQVLVKGLITNVQSSQYMNLWLVLGKSAWGLKQFIIFRLNQMKVLAI
jgi:hypothetical protein